MTPGASHGLSLAGPPRHHQGRAQRPPGSQGRQPTRLPPSDLHASAVRSLPLLQRAVAAGTHHARALLRREFEARGQPVQWSKPLRPPSQAADRRWGLCGRRLPREGARARAPAHRAGLARSAPAPEEARGRPGVRRDGSAARRPQARLTWWKAASRLRRRAGLFCVWPPCSPRASARSPGASPRPGGVRPEGEAGPARGGRGARPGLAGPGPPGPAGDPNADGL